MAESLNVKYDKRAIFPSGEQGRFLLMARKSLGLPWSQFADKIKVHKRTLNNWKRGACSMPLGVLKKVCKVARLKMPTRVEIRDPFWYVSKGSRAGWLAVYKKYGRVGGDPEYRKRKWREWWGKEGKYKKHPIINVPKSIKKPYFSKELAEFVGIMLGDGGISKYQLSITLHRFDDKEYSKIVVALVKKLFNVPVGTYYRKKDLSVSFIISRIELVRFSVDTLGLKIGNKIKQQVDIPDWIKQNKLYSIACVRGLIDTDGSVFTHKYQVNGKFYKYKKLAFTSCSKPLRHSVFSILKNNGMKPRLAQDRDVRIDSIADVKRYFEVFNSHNSKHLKRFKN